MKVRHSPTIWLARGIATAGGAGYSPIAPGTCGTAVAMPFIYLTATWSLPLYAALTVAITVIGIWAAELADRSWGTHDSGRIVIDEVAGAFVTMIVVGDRSNLVALVIGFFVFRLFDIVKPWPVRLIDQKMGGGAGVVLDDVAAGIYGAGVMALLMVFHVPDYLAGLLGL